MFRWGRTKIMKSIREIYKFYPAFTRVELKIAIAGKGGVGKTMVGALLARILARKGFRVLAIDVDPSLNMAASLGVQAEIASKIRPLSEEIEMIESRTKTSFGPVLNLTPRVDDIIERHIILAPDGVRLVAVGTVRAGGEGCQCPENAFVRAVLAQLILGHKDIAILDMGAGLEHLGRGTAKGVDLMLCIVEPTIKAFDVASRVVRLSKDLEIKEVWGVVNKLVKDRDESFVKQKSAEVGIKMVEFIPYDESIVEAERKGISPIDLNPDGEAVKAIGRLSRKLDDIRYGP